MSKNKPNDACPTPQPQDDEEVRQLLSSIKNIAVVGMSSKPHRPSRGVGLYLDKHGFNVIPVHPRETEIEGMKVYADLETIPEDIHIDLVDLFVSGEPTVNIVEQAANIGPPAVWFQPGAEHQPAIERAKQLGLKVICGRCAMADHARLFD